MSDNEIITTKAAAEACDITPRLLRQFLRASDAYQAVGSGGRYSFKPTDLPTLEKRFIVWITAREAAAKARAEAEKTTPAEAAAVQAKPATRGRKSAA